MRLTPRRSASRAGVCCGDRLPHPAQWSPAVGQRRPTVIHHADCHDQRTSYRSRELGSPETSKEGLITGMVGKPTIRTLVERSTRYVMLCRSLRAVANQLKLNRRSAHAMRSAGKPQPSASPNCWRLREANKPPVTTVRYRRTAPAPNARD